MLSPLFSQKQTVLDQNLEDFENTFDMCSRERFCSFADILSTPSTSSVLDYNVDQDLNCHTDSPQNFSLSPHIVDDYLYEEKPAPIAFRILVPTNFRKIGTLSLEERKLKVAKFQEKKKKRCWGKKINYKCRKQVADQRLRVKGRFIAKSEMGSKTKPECL